MCDSDLREACSVVIVPGLQYIRCGMSSFPVFALACTLYPWIVHSRLNGPMLHIFFIDDVDGFQVSVSWLFVLVSGVENLLAPRGLLFM